MLSPKGEAKRVVPRGQATLQVMDDLPRRLLRLFIEMGSDTLDLHTLFEAGGNDPATRKQVLDELVRLVDRGELETRGSDFYALTEKGRKAIT